MRYHKKPTWNLTVTENDKYIYLTFVDRNSIKCWEKELCQNFVWHFKVFIYLLELKVVFFFWFFLMVVWPFVFGFFFLVFFSNFHFLKVHLQTVTVVLSLKQYPSPVYESEALYLYCIHHAFKCSTDWEFFWGRKRRFLSRRPILFSIKLFS